MVLDKFKILKKAEFSNLSVSESLSLLSATLLSPHKGDVHDIGVAINRNR
jgi:hypothetical protein